jgi:hypothetical protein
MRRRTKLVLNARHHLLGLHPPCPHPPHRLTPRRPRLLELAGYRVRCEECWRTWTVRLEPVPGDYDWMTWQDVS